ncbi:hypothetical protein [Wandonia haliotis]|uniref:hypothetical protein n=1 Tax=Wandonia haliotis TaxID=574963 RepID=UPI0031D3C06F
MTRTISVILLIAVLYIPFLGLRTYFELERKQIRKEVKRKLMSEVPVDQLVELRFSKHTIDREVNWKHSKEFEYRGEMYDIVYRKEKNDSLFFHCWWDREETALNQRVNQLATICFAKNTDPESRTAKLKVVCEKEYIPLHILLTELQKFQSHYEVIADRPPEIYFDISLEIPVPPPRLVA